MKHFILSLVLLLAAMSVFAINIPPLVPFPNSYTPKEGEGFIIDSLSSITIDDPQLMAVAEELQEIIKKHTGLEIPVVDNRDSEIKLCVDPSLENKEHYILDIDKDGVMLRGATPEGVFRGVSTLRQLFLNGFPYGRQNELAAVTIDDRPRYGYRAMMLDPARHFLPVEDVKRFIDLMAQYKFNVLQLHLTDDQGWRVMMEQHPEIVSEQAYTRDDIKDIIDFAASRYVEVIPEVDIPGHTSAFLAAYPELGCVHKHEEEIIVGKTDNRMLCAANTDVYEIFEDIFEELCNLFSSSYIHLGGDEAAVKANWAKCERCLALMEESGLTDPSQLMIPFFDKMLGFVRENGKKPILWCELNNIYPPADDFLFPYPKDVTLVTWRGGLTPTCLELTGKAGYPLIMAPGEYAYLDYPQLKGDLPEFNNWGMPISPLSRTYKFDPGYGLPEDQQAHVMGVMGTLWGEAINDINRATYMAFPRAMALAEAGWTRMENRGWDGFKQRMYPNLYELMRNGVSFRVPFEVAEE